MTKFEFLMMIASVVVAVGMTEIVGGWGRLARGQRRAYPLFDQTNEAQRAAMAHYATAMTAKAP